MLSPKKQREAAASAVELLAAKRADAGTSAGDKKPAASKKEEKMLGAPTPAGMPGKMHLTSAEDLNTAFEMLETESGVLNRVQARTWLRCAGWALPDSELNEMLDTATFSKARTRAGTSAERTKWGLRQLLDINETERESRPNKTAKDLQDAMRLLAGDRSRISRAQLSEFTLQGEGLTEDDFSQVLHALGFDGVKQLDIPMLTERLMKKVVDPPSIHELHELVNTKSCAERTSTPH